ncbi:hypothetical protein EB796_009734 [Bugula neritina]|nr:hypothetical protein EB796_009734 [Bugula neritina]
MPNLYIQLGDGPRWLVSNTDQDPTHFVLPFDAKNKLQRASDDLILPLSLSERYLYQTKLNQFSELEVRAKLVPDVLELFSLNRRTEYTPQYGNLLNSVPPSGNIENRLSLLDFSPLTSTAA